MEHINPMKNSIRMIYGMMITLTLLILVSIVIDAKTTPEKRDPATQSPANLNPPSAVDAGSSNEESAVGGGGVGKGGVIQVPIEREEAPQKIIDTATAYLQALLGPELLGPDYVKEFIQYKESYLEKVYVDVGIINPSLPEDLPEDGREADIQGAPVQRDVAKSEEWWIIVYDYNFKAQGQVDPMARIIVVYLDKNGKIVRYEGPERAYTFKLGVDDVKKIAREAGMETPNEAYIRAGWVGWLADDSLVLGDEKESILWQVISNNPEVGTPEIVYIHPDTGEVLGIYTRQEMEFVLFGGIIPTPEADSQQKTATQMNEKVKAGLAKLRARVPKVDEEKMKRFIEKAQEQKGESQKGALAYFFSRIASFFATIF
ncbi:hypothetical protein HYS50_02810 [Candidatus Woesearchaeota archaeon]|nr:hypothetical protein [Candidatus Woesearchaeota archaeon]